MTRAEAQVVFVSATVPAQGSGTVGAFLESRFPAIRWIRSDGAHRPVPQLTSEFINVADADERRAALVRLCQERGGRILVFANSVSRAVEARRVLSGAGFEAAECFHPDMPPSNREAALDRFASSSEGLLVCSGLAARGIDVPDIQLVIEYQMAPNLIEHVHRIGRTARAGREGHAVSLVNSESEGEAALVAEVQRCVKGGWKYI